MLPNGVRREETGTAAAENGLAATKLSLSLAVVALSRSLPESLLPVAAAAARRPPDLDDLDLFLVLFFCFN